MNKQNNVKKQEGIKNPSNTISGKIIIWILIALMGLLPLVGLIFALINL